MTKPDVEVVRIEPRHQPALTEFFNAVWSAEGDSGQRVDPDFYPESAGMRAPQFAVLIQGRVVGYIATIDATFWNGSEDRSGHWLKGFMVLPEHRNGPIGYLVLKEATRHLGLAAALTVASASRRLFEALGYKNLGQLANFVLPLRPATVLRGMDVEAIGLAKGRPWLGSAMKLAQRTGLATAAGLAAATLMRTHRLKLSAQTRRFKSARELQAAPSDEINSLWERTRAAFSAAPTRADAYLRTRYFERNRAYYASGLVRERDRLMGWAVVKKPRANGDPRLRGIRVASLSDILFPVDRRDAGVATVLLAARIAHDLGADALLCSASHHALRATLAACGFLRFPANVHFLFRDAGQHERWADINQWWLTRGDAYSDETF